MAKRSKQQKWREPETMRVVETKRETVEKIQDSKPPGANGKLILLQAMLIAVAGLWVFWPALRGDWLWDDDRFITDNFQLRSLEGLWSIWFAPGSRVEYYPLEQTMLWIEWQLWHSGTLGYHIVTLVLHLLSALLVWRLLGKMGLRLAWLGGLLFVIHPVQVESAAWISELKNTLSLPPLLLAMGFYLDYEERGRGRDYLLALGLFLAALLCKLTVVMFPVIILLYMWWKRGRIGWNDLKVSAPFFMLSLAVGMVTILSGVWNHQFAHLAPGDVPDGGFLARLVLAGQEIAFYFSKSFLPVELLTIYPKWAVHTASLLDYLPCLVLGGVIGWLWTKRQSWGRHALLGLGFFVVNLAPCPGFIPIPNMGFAWAMDHFLYLPIIGLIGLVVAAMGQVKERLAPRLQPVGVGIVAAIIALLAWESHGYAGLYINQKTLWTYTLQSNPEAWLAHNNLGNSWEERGNISEAMGQYEEALRLNPNYAPAYNNLGNILKGEGRMSEAMAQYEEALRINPDYADAHNDLAVALAQSGRVPESIKQFKQALKLNPDYADAHNNLGNVLLQTGQVPEAMDQYEEALRLRPDYAEAHYNLGTALEQAGREPEAMGQYEQALQINPDYAEAHSRVGLALLQKGQVDEAITHFQRALKIIPNFTEARNDLAVALVQEGRVDEAIVQLQEAVRLDPNNSDVRNNLAKVEAMARPAAGSK